MKPSRKVTKAGLSAQEKALWEHAAKSMSPLRKAKARVLARSGEEDEFWAAVAEPAPKRRVKAENAGAAAKSGGTGPGPLSKPPRSPASVSHGSAGTPPLADFDRKNARRLRSGQIDVTSRIDLHGMRQDEAHAVLRRFLLKCQTRGERWVLVITGKGGPRRPDDGDDHGGRSEPGVLRRNVPRWLNEPDLRAIVVSFTQAALHHGGGGAIYVQLRKRV